MDYVREHPGASADEIRAFMTENSADGNADTKQLVALARAQGSRSLLWICGQFLMLGIEHILHGPDHILFVFSLLLTFETFRKTTALLSCFTLSHSVTLLLAGSRVLRISNLLVEPLIALSIVYVAMTSIFLARRYLFFASAKTKALTVLGFGFFHGMGFAGALEDITLPTDTGWFIASLLSFNLGVDVGQIAIVIGTLPIVLLVQRCPYRHNIIRIIAVLISTLAMMWFLQRILTPG